MPENFWIGIVGSLAFGWVGIFLLISGFKLFDKILSKINFQTELQKDPIAIAIVIGSFFLSLAHIIASCVS